jgi:hypothetical protein
MKWKCSKDPRTKCLKTHTVIKIILSIFELGWLISGQTIFYKTNKDNYYIIYMLPIIIYSYFYILAYLFFIIIVILVLFKMIDEGVFNYND